MKGIDNKNKKIDEFENYFFKDSDITFVISTNLKNKAKKVTKDVLFLPAGVELNKFDIKNVKKKILVKGKPIIGYIGAITEVFDQDLVEFICEKNPNLNFVIIGRKYVNVKKLEKFKNVFFLNEIKHNKLPSYIKGFDLGIIPYKVNEFTHSVYSSKLNEYLAMGLPVVSTNLKESKIYNKNFNNIINIGKTFEQFDDKIKESLTKSSSHEFNISENLSFTLREARENFEREYLTSQLKKFSGNISKTAKFVGMERSALHRKLKLLEIKEFN